MSIRNWLRRIPFAVAVYRKVTAPRREHARKYVSTQLDIDNYSQGRQIRDALVALQAKLDPPDQNWIDRIEIERERLLKCGEPLFDNSLGTPSVFDINVSIKDACLASKPPEPALLLFLLTRALNPQSVIELGTNVGISSSYIAAGQIACGRNGKIITFDASAYRLRLAKEVHHNLGLDNILYKEGLFADKLAPALNSLGHVDLAFIDGHHQYQPTIDYFEEVLKFSTTDTVFVFDDIRWSDGMKKGLVTDTV